MEPTVPTNIKIISESSAIEQIVETVKKSKPGAAPFAFIVGAGFSDGLVPITRDIVHESLPRLDKSFISNNFKTLPPPTPVRFNDILKHQNDEMRRRERHEKEERNRRAISFWKIFIEKNQSNGLGLILTDKGFPENEQLAYQYAFDYDNFKWPFANQEDGHKFLHGLMKPDPPRLNAAHFFLASILGTQPNVISKQGSFKFQAAFSRLIVTTNFDPFLQVALQYANRLYFMSDTPDLKQIDLSEDYMDAIHLVYLHGSIHRHNQADTKQKIREIKEKNATVLAPILKNRAIIVIGYSGWDDVVVKALAACDKFEYGLYWLGRRPRPHEKGIFEILVKSGACYVQIKGADHFMNQLHKQLVHGLPLLDNPIASLRRKLTLVDLHKLDDLEISPVETSLNGVTKIARHIVDKPTFKFAKQIALQGLEIAESAFFKQCEEASIKQLKIQARQENICAEKIKICDKALTIPNLSAEHRVWFLKMRSETLFQFFEHDKAIDDLTQIIDMPNVSNKNRWQARYERGVAFSQEEKIKNPSAALFDLKRIIEEIPDKPDTPKDLQELRTMSLYHIGSILCDIGEHKESISVLTGVIEIFENASDQENLVSALNKLAYVWEQVPDYDEAAKTYDKISKLPWRAPCGRNEDAIRNRNRVLEKKSGF
jgi:SIR2-like domain